jgi:predicted transcriptional regulator
MRENVHGHFKARPKTHGDNRRELCTASYSRSRSGFRSHCHSTPGAWSAGQPTQPGEVLVPAVSVRRSVSPNEVVCMDCGWRGKTLRRHITTRHFLSRDEYLKRWELRHEHPLTAPAYSERRSILAKELGLGRKPAAQATLAAITTAWSPAGADGNSEAKPSRRRNARSGSKSGDLTNEAVAAPTTPRKRRARARVASPEAEQNPSSTAET